MNVETIERENSLQLIQIPLAFQQGKFGDLFGQKNNKTLAETYLHPRYASLARKLHGVYDESLDRPLGKFLLDLKTRRDANYKFFLNKHGDLTYCHFRLRNSADWTRKGVYFYFIEGELMYIGRCRDSMRKRIDLGYGKIHPKNCFIDGQSTNCHLNAKIAQHRSNVALWLAEMALDSEIVSREVELIRKYKPQWNIQRA